MSQPSAVLFDELGPKARARVRVLTVVVAVVIALVVVLAAVRLARNGQFAAELWAPLLDPTTEEFPLVWARLLRGLVTTLWVAAVAVVSSLVLGVLIAVARLSLGRVGRLPLVGVVELLRGLPVVVTILLASVTLPVIGVDVSDNWYLVVGLVLYNCVVISEIVRAGVVAVPRGQYEAGQAIGLRPGQVMRSIQLPQAFRAMLPAIVSQLVVILKDTALGALVLNGTTELTREARRLANTLDNLLQMLVVIGVIYIVLNLVLGRVAVLVERRLSRSTSTAPEAVEEEVRP